MRRKRWRMLRMVVNGRGSGVYWNIQEMQMGYRVTASLSPVCRLFANKIQSLLKGWWGWQRRTFEKNDSDIFDNNSENPQSDQIWKKTDQSWSKHEDNVQKVVILCYSGQVTTRTRVYFILHLSAQQQKHFRSAAKNFRSAAKKSVRSRRNFPSWVLEDQNMNYMSYQFNIFTKLWN